jgi:hypothetical protein
MKEEIRNILNDGVHVFDDILDKDDVGRFYEKIIKSREFGSCLFITEQEYLAQESNLNTNPSSEFNFLNEFSDELGFVEGNVTITQVISELLGDDYEIVLKKIVCGVPESWLPDWVRALIEGVNVANLGPYVKKKFRDITYFRGIDFHQDIIDFPKGKVDLDPSTFLTLYTYIHDVDIYDSPLYVLPKSHQMGATLFPHKLKKIADKVWSYKDDKGNQLECEEKVLTGKAGYVAMWHNCTLHGTQPIKHESEKFRLSLRYLIGKSNKNKQKTLIDEINSTIKGELQPIRTRQDLDSLGKAKIKGCNIINQ